MTTVEKILNQFFHDVTTLGYQYAIDMLQWRERFALECGDTERQETYCKALWVIYNAKG